MELNSSRAGEFSAAPVSKFSIWRTKRLLVTKLFAKRTSDNPSHVEREVWLIKADGSDEPRYLAEGYWPSWSSDSKKVFYHSQPDNILYAVPIEAGARPAPIAQCTGSYPTVSPGWT